MTCLTTGYSIIVANLAEPMNFIGQPKLSHSTQKGGTSFSWEYPGRPPIAWRHSERARVIVEWNGEQMFVGNITSREVNWGPPPITTYNAVGYFTHARRQPIIGEYRGTIFAVIERLLDDSGARAFLQQAAYYTGEIDAGLGDGSKIAVKEIQIDYRFDGKYLDECLDEILNANGAHWCIKPETGNLVIWQNEKLTALPRGINIQSLIAGKCDGLQVSNIKPQLIFSDINRVVVARNSESVESQGISQAKSSVKDFIKNSVENFMALGEKTEVVKAFKIVPAAGCTDRVINAFAGYGSTTFTYDIPALDASFDNQRPSYITINDNGVVFFIQNRSSNQNIVAKVDPADGILRRYAGGLSFSNFPATPGPANATALGTLGNLDADQNGNLFVADFGYRFIYKIDSSGILSYVAGSVSGTTWQPPFTPASATSVFLHGRPSFAAVDRNNGDVYIWCNSATFPTVPATINKISGGTITNVLRADVNSEINFVSDIAVSRAGVLYMALAQQHKVIKYQGGTLVTVAGTGVSGFSGDDGPAASAEISSPQGICFDEDDNLYIALGDVGASAGGPGRRVRMVDNSGIITTIAGTGVSGSSGNGGPAINAQFQRLQDVAALNNTVYTSDFNDKKIRVITC